MLIGERAPRADCLGNLKPSHGLRGMRRSLTPEPKTAARMRKRVSTVAGDDDIAHDLTSNFNMVGC